MIKDCVVCGNEFETEYPIKATCSFDCRREWVRRKGLAHRRDHARASFYDPRGFTAPRPSQPCVVCGWDETTDLHHDIGATYILCPNHHALITRGIKTIEELLNCSQNELSTYCYPVDNCYCNDIT